MAYYVVRGKAVVDGLNPLEALEVATYAQVDWDCLEVEFQNQPKKEQRRSPGATLMSSQAVVLGWAFTTGRIGGYELWHPVVSLCGFLGIPAPW